MRRPTSLGAVILSDATLRELISAGYIVLDPYDPELVQPASVDVRLGTEFRVMRNSRLTHIDPFEPQQKLMDTVTVPDGEPFVLHPGEFALGHTSRSVRSPCTTIAVSSPRCTSNHALEEWNHLFSGDIGGAMS